MVTKKEQIYQALLEKLSVREQKFVTSYLQNTNATKSAKAAGYGSPGTESASTLGWRLLQNVEIAEAIQAGTDVFLERNEVTTERLIHELVIIASASREHYFIDSEGKVVLEEGAPPEAMRAIRSVKRTRTVHADGSVSSRTEYQLWDRIKALELLGRKLKLWIDKVEIEDSQSAA
jgi:phage terminase small subunit